MKPVWIIGVIVLIVLTLGILWFVLHQPTAPLFAGASRPLPGEIRRMLDGWSIQASVLRTVQVLLAIIAIIGSVASAADLTKLLSGPKKDETAARLKSIAAISAAVAVALLTGLDLGGKSNRFRAAWRRLNDQATRYAYNQTPPVTLKDLFDAEKDGETMIGDVKENLK
jgi:hypothetical protein